MEEDELTLRRAKEGDPDAFSRLMLPRQQALWRFCWSILRNDQNAHDAVQETMLKAWRSLPGYRGEAPLNAWLMRIARNCCLDSLRAARAHPTESVEEMAESGHEPRDSRQGPEEALEKKEERRVLRESLDKLSPEHREALILFTAQGRSYEEIAELTGVAVGTVKSRISRARAELLKLTGRAEKVKKQRNFSPGTPSSERKEGKSHEVQ